MSRFASDQFRRTLWSPILDHKPTIDTPDDDFDSSTLDGKWTAVTGASGTVDLESRSNTNNIYDLSTRSGWLLLQTGVDGTSDSVALRQDYTLPDGASIIAAYAPAINIDGTPGFAANQHRAELAINDNDTARDSGNFQLLVVRTDASNIVVEAFDGATAYRYTAAMVPMVYLRIVRSNLTYYHYISTNGGASWHSIGNGYTESSALSNLWIFANAEAAFGGPSPVHAVDWIRQGTNNLDPW